MYHKDYIIRAIEELCLSSTEKIEKLKKFVNLIVQCNSQVNLIGKSTIEDIWNRHILDSAQLIKIIKNNNISLVDFGSGAGLPGIVLSILGIKKVYLIEKSVKKSNFLKTAAKISDNVIYVMQENVENIAYNKFDVITSRALAPLHKLINLSQRFLNNDNYCLFLKGKNVNKEIIEAKKNFNFSYSKYPSITSNDSCALKVKISKYDK